MGNHKEAKKELRTTRKERRQILGKEKQKQCCCSPITRSKAIERKPNFTENGLSGTTKQSFISYGHRSKRKTRQTFVGDKKVNRKIEEVSNSFTLFKYGRLIYKDIYMRYFKNIHKNCCLEVSSLNVCNAFK